MNDNGGSLKLNYDPQLFHDWGRYHIKTSPLIWLDWLDWFLYDSGLHRERVKGSSCNAKKHWITNKILPKEKNDNSIKSRNASVTKHSPS